MTHIQRLLLLVLLSQAPSACADSHYRLVWADEFDSASTSPDARSWSYEHGFVRNREMQFYTRGRKENARIENGMLVIESRKETFPNPRFKAGSSGWRQARKNAQYTSASLHTLGKHAWKYGRIEIRARLPRGKGMWPAIWMMGTDRPQVGWPRCGEIDIMENIGKNPERVHGTIHYAAGQKGRAVHRSNGGSTVSRRALHRAFHLYGIEWTAEKIDFLFDGKIYHSVDLTRLPPEQAAQFRKPHYLIINLALGGSWAGEIDDTRLPQKYFIDYVRVYQQPSLRKTGLPAR